LELGDYRDGEPLPARLREDGFKTKYTATVAGPKIMYWAAGQYRLGKIAARHPTDLPINNHVQLPGLLPLRRLLSFAE
jgi:hypothetical protein